jgi:HlyD family secretion protein
VDAFPSQRFHGRVVQVRNSPVTLQNVVTYDTIIEVANPELKLKPGMTANVSIVVANREGVLTVPNAALRFRPPDSANGAQRGAAGGGPNGTANAKPRGGASAGRTVYLAPNGRERRAPERVPVTTGITDGVLTEIVEGLQEGDAIVIGVRLDQANANSRSGSNNPFRGGGPGRF